LSFLIIQRLKGGKTTLVSVRKTHFLWIDHLVKLLRRHQAKRNHGFLERDPLRLRLLGNFAAKYGLAITVIILVTNDATTIAALDDHVTR
jgi:hypothetical protein